MNTSSKWLRSFAVFLVASLVIGCGSGGGGSGKKSLADGGSGGAGGDGGAGGQEPGEGGSGGSVEPGAWLEPDSDRIRVPLFGETRVRVTLDREVIGDGDVLIELAGDLPDGVSLHPASGLEIFAGETKGTLRFSAGSGVRRLDRPSEVLLRATSDGWSGEAILRIEVAAIVTSDSESDLRDFISTVLDIRDNPTIWFDRELSPSTIYLSAPLVIDEAIRFEGWVDQDEVPQFTFYASGSNRLFEIGSVEAALARVRVANGTSPGQGGCILNAGSLRLEQVEVMDCDGNEGGGLYSTGPVELDRVVFKGNRSQTHGGGAFLRGDQSIENSVFQFNQATLHGGGLVSYTSLEMEGTTFRNNQAGEMGGGVRLHGASSISRSIFRDNRAGTLGGAIYQAGSRDARLVESTLEGNQASAGAGIYGHDGSAITILGTIFEGNQAAEGSGVFARPGFLLVLMSGCALRENHGDAIVLEGNSEGRLLSSSVSDTRGRGIVVPPGGTFSVISSTVSGNQTTNPGTGITSQGVLRVINSTIANNRSDGYGAGLLIAGGAATLEFMTLSGNTSAAGGALTMYHSAVTIRTSILAGNHSTATSPDVLRGDGMAFTSGGYNLYGDLTDSGVTGLAVSDRSGTAESPVDPLLELLADNGGEEGFLATKTFALRKGSWALDRIPPGACNAQGAPLETDQRGMPRPVGEECDIGAFESQVTP